MTNAFHATHPSFEGYAALDTETTGLKAGSDKIAELAIVLINTKGQITDHWDTLINPKRPMGGTDIHGITDKLVSNAPYFSEVAPHITSLLQNRILVAHNAAFDARFLSYELGQENVYLNKNHFLCTLKLSRKKFPSLERHRLADMTQKFGIELLDAHAAIADTVACAELFKQLGTVDRKFTGITEAEVFNRQTEIIEGLELPKGFSRLPDFTCNHCPLDEALMPW